MYIALARSLARTEPENYELRFHLPCLLLLVAIIHNPAQVHAAALRYAGQQVEKERRRVRPELPAAILFCNGLNA